jgi:hypothetical protein
MKQPESSVEEKNTPRYLLGIFLVSFATLLLELSLVRVLSVALWYHFGFLVISTALLGFGVSGVVLTLSPKLRDSSSPLRALSLLSLAFAFVTIASFWLMQRIPFDPFSLAAERRQLLLMPTYYIVLAAPFFFSGLIIAFVLTRGWKSANKIYAADLAGAGLGCAAIAFVMPAVGGSGTVVVAAALGFLAATVFAWRVSRRLVFVGGLLAAVSLALAFSANRLLPITVVKAKTHPLQKGAVGPIYTAWNTISRVDLYRLPAMPEAGRPGPGFGIMIDGGSAGTAMADLHEGVRTYLATEDKYRPTGLAFISKQHPSLLIIGSGAGREVLEGLYHGAKSITAVEINPSITDIVSRRFKEYWGGLFAQPGVKLVTEDGRSYVRRSKDKYDAIISVQTMSMAAMESGALSLAEDYVLTTEAFDDYIDHLTDDGVIMFTRPPLHLVRLFATIRTVCERRGIGNPAQHLYAFRAEISPWGHARFNNGMLFKKSAFTPDEIRTIEERLGIGQQREWPGEARPPEVLYSPLNPGTGSDFDAILSAPDLGAFLRAREDDLSPVTDNRPFFNHTMKWSALRMDHGLDLFRVGRREPTTQPVAEIVLVMILVQSVLIAGGLIILPLWRFSRQGVAVPGRWSFLIYFASLGLGYIMIEMVFLQRFTLFLGQPIYTFAAILGSLLLSSGIGSFAAGLFRVASRQVVVGLLSGVLVVLAASGLFVPPILHVTLGLPLLQRVLLAMLLTAPVGAILGTAFPLGLRLVGLEIPALVPWAWGVNGFFTVIGSVVAIILGMAFGFTLVLAVAGGCYLCALVAISRVPSIPGSPRGAATALERRL